MCIRDRCMLVLGSADRSLSSSWGCPLPRCCHGAGFPKGGRARARGLRKVLGGVGLLGVEPGPTAATGGRRAVERPLGLPTSVCVCTRTHGRALGKALAARPRGAGWLARWEVGARGLRRGPHRPRGGRPSGCRDCRRGRPPLLGLGTVGEVWVLLPLAARCPSRGAAGTPRFGRRGEAPPSLL